MLKIILTGPESCGKTTLARQLAKHFDVPLVEEYVREYFEKKQTPQYQEADLKEIAMGQMAAEKKVENILFKQFTRKNRTKKPLFFICDTDILTIKIWSEEKYGRCDEWIMDQFQISDFKFQIPDIPLSSNSPPPSNFKLQTSNILLTSNFKLQTLYLLCSPEGIEWEADPLRENPHDRERLFEVYEKQLILCEKSYKILRGDIFERFEFVKNMLL
jgi:nicotinamide riboside kinase